MEIVYISISRRLLGDRILLIGVWNDGGEMNNGGFKGGRFLNEKYGFMKLLRKLINLISVLFVIDKSMLGLFRAKLTIKFPKLMVL